MENRKKFKFIDLFAGIGGMRLAFEHAGGDCVFSSEWNKYSVETYRANFGNDQIVAGDITKIPAKDIPLHDVLVAGFPCQPFSLAGVSKKNSLGRKHGFLDKTQGTLMGGARSHTRRAKPSIGRYGSGAESGRHLYWHYFGIYACGFGARGL